MDSKNFHVVLYKLFHHYFKVNIEGRCGGGDANTIM